MAAASSLLLLLAAAPAQRQPAQPAPAAVLAAAKRALTHWTSANPLAEATCAWTDSTLLLGVMEYQKASNDPLALAGATAWAERQHYRVCGDKSGQLLAAAAERGPPPPPAGTDDDSCRVWVRDVEYVDASVGAAPAASFAECCERCRALPGNKCGYFTFAAGRCSLQATATRPKAAKGALSGWPAGGPCPPQCRHVAGGVRGPHGANSQLCAATYIELAQLNTSHSTLAGVARILDAEIASGSASASAWSWVDALFMSMNVYARMGAVTSNVSYYEKQWQDFHDAALAPPDRLSTYGPPPAPSSFPALSGGRLVA